MIDRTSIRRRPSSLPLMHQRWGRLLFLHWAFPVETLRPLVPPELEIDTFEGRAWVGMTPFTMWGVRPSFLPPVPLLSRSHELNVRTYVHAEGVPGVWFLSLDASNAAAVAGARLAFHLPYHRARMTLRQSGRSVRFSSRRREAGARPAELQADWTWGEPLPAAEPETLAFFLIERYCLYTKWRDRLYRGQIHHRPWPLRRAHLTGLHSTMLQSHGLPAPPEQPLVHGQAAPLHVRVWPLQRV